VSDGDSVLASVELALRAVFAAIPVRASTSFLGVEPIEVLRFDSGPVLSYVTLGMSRRPMTPGSAGVIDDDGPRAELLVQTRGDGGGLWRRLMILAAAPVVEGVVYVEGVTVDLGVGLDVGSACTGGLVVNSALPPALTPAGPVDVLRVVPATSSELAWSRVHGSDALRRRWDEQATDLLDLGRRGVDLT